MLKNSTKRIASLVMSALMLAGTTAFAPSSALAASNDIYVSAGDVNALLNALTTVEAGGVIHLASGTYTFPSESASTGTDAANIKHKVKMFSTNSGTASGRKTLTCDDGYATLDFSAHSEDSTNRGIQIDGDYWNVSNMKIKGAGDNGMLVTGKHVNVTNCVFEANHDTGLQIARRASSLTSMADWPCDVTVKNCTSFNNKDDATGENADGFAAKLTCGEGIKFIGCMAYNNVDDGWDLYTKKESGKIGSIQIIDCIAFRNGMTSTGQCTKNSDGNGFKLGGECIAVNHVVTNCIAFENKKHGFTDNSNPGVITLTNCTSFNNGTDDGSNIDLARGKDSYNKFNYILPYSNTAVSADKYIGDATNSVFFNSKKWYKVAGSGVKVDVKNSGGYKGEQFAGLTDSNFYSLSSPAIGTDFHSVWRNNNNNNGVSNINIGSFLKVKPGTAFTNSIDLSVLGAHLNGSGSTPVITTTEKTTETTTKKTTTTTKKTTTTTKKTTTTTKKTTTTTKATTTTEKSTETTTQRPSNAVSNGTYKLNKSTLSGKKCTYNNMTFSLRSVESKNVKLRSENTITFTLAEKTKVTLDPAGKGVKISGSASKSLGTGTVSVTLNAGSYTISGANSGSNTTISYIKFEQA